MEHPPPLDIDKWVDVYADDLYRTASRRLLKPQDAEDAVQETLLSALKSADSFRGDSSERTWLFGILKLKVVDQIRLAVKREAVQGTFEQDDAFDASGRWRRPPADFGILHEDLVEREEFWEQVRACLAELPSRQATAFLGKEIEDRTTEEVCKELEISATNLWVILHRARLRLRACLERRWFRTGGRQP